MTLTRSLFRTASLLCAAGLMTTASVHAAQQADEPAQSQQAAEDQAQSQSEKQKDAAQQNQDTAQQDKSQQQRDTADRSRGTNTRQQPVFLGVRVQASPTTGVYVRDVMPQSPAAQGGIEERDYILSVDGHKIASQADFDRALRQIQPNSSAKFEIWRNREKQELTVTFPERRMTARRPDFNELNERGQVFDNDESKVAWLGVMLRDLQDEPQRQTPDQNQDADQKMPKNGVRITGVYPSGPAARAGIRGDDIVTKIDDEDVTSPDEFIRMIDKHNPDDTVTFTVIRDGEEMTKSATLANRADFTVYSANAPQADQRGRYGDYSRDDVSGHAVMLEQHRRFAEQHQRIEQRLDELVEEVRNLRQQVEQKEQKQ